VLVSFWAECIRSGESTRSSHIWANDHRAVFDTGSYALARVCARRGQEGIHCAVLWRVFEGRGCGRAATFDGGPSDGTEHCASTRQSACFHHSLNPFSVSHWRIAKPAKTVFKRMHYDRSTDTSVLRCKFDWKPLTLLFLSHAQTGRPLTGRCTSSPDSYQRRFDDLLPAHQIRVHLQFLGHPIANDPVYSETKIWARSGPSSIINRLSSSLALC
jgi:hypothetical protein